MDIDRLGNYEILDQIGAGGMGVVYRARDSKLHREVAIKVLPRNFATDTVRLGRFDREAKLAAALNHPNIAAIYGFEEDDGHHYLVLELVPGVDLAHKIRGVALPLEDTLRIGRQIARALDHAHKLGIIHRDLKPSNVKVTPDGTAKILDFGLAKALDREVGDPDLSQSPTLAGTNTVHGAILGTAAYMAPEQARGLPVDKRGDVWSFGCVLFECLAGSRAFKGETASDAIAKILERDPDWAALPKDTPPILLRLLRRCLTKDPDQRLHDIADARVELEELISDPSQSASYTLPGGPGYRPPHTPLWKKRWARFAGAGLLVFGLGTFLGLEIAPQAPPSDHAPADPEAVTRFGIHLGEQEGWLGASNPVSFSPDGRRLLYLARAGGRDQVHVHDLSRFEGRPVNLGDIRVNAPRFLPDGERFHYLSGSTLYRAPLRGGSPEEVVSPVYHGYDWAEWGGLVFPREWGGPLYALRDSAGARPGRLTELRFEQGERGHLHPEVLPGGRHVLFTVWTGESFDHAWIALADLLTREHEILLRGGSQPRYSPSGHMVYAAGATLMAIKLDPLTYRVVGEAQPVVDGVMGDADTGSSFFDISDRGDLVYVPGESRTFPFELVVVDTAGAPLANLGEVAGNRATRFGSRFAFSPDGRSLAVELSGPQKHLGVYRRDREAVSRITFEGDNTAPAWHPDGARLVFASERGGSRGLYRAAADGSSSPREFVAVDARVEPGRGGWTPDGNTVLFTRHTGENADVVRYTEPPAAAPGDTLAAPDTTAADTAAADVADTADTGLTPGLHAVIASPANETDPTLSSDGRWLAYVSDETGNREIYLQPFPELGGRLQVSVGGGHMPQWSTDGTRILFLSGGVIRSVTVTPVEGGSRRSVELGRVEPALDMPAVEAYAVAPDGLSFAVLRADTTYVYPSEIRVVQNLARELEQKLP